MKPIFNFLLLAAFAAASAVPAQEAVEPLPSAPAAPGASAADSGTLIPEPPPLIPKGSSALDSSALPAAQKAFQNSKTGVAATDLDLHIRYRKAETQALQDPKFDELKKEAYGRKTEPEKRAGLKRYYAALYGRILKIDSSLKAEIDKRKDVAVGRLDQTKLRATGSDAELESRAE